MCDHHEPDPVPTPDLTRAQRIALAVLAIVLLAACAILTVAIAHLPRAGGQLGA